VGAAVGPSAVAAGGLVLDIAGGLLLASGLMFKKPQQVVRETVTWGGDDVNVDLDASLAKQTADARIGATLLALGFSVQLAGALGWHRTSDWRAVIYATVSAFLLDLAAVVLLLRVWRPRHLRAMLVTRLAVTQNVLHWRSILTEYGPLLGERSTRLAADQETTAEYAERLLGWRWKRLTADVTLPELYTKLRRDIPGTPQYAEAHPADAT
jgi:hypothetical protein